MAVKNTLLNDVRINKIVRNLADQLVLDQPLTYLNRVPMGDVYDNSQILATYSSRIYMADIIMDDSRARVVETGAMTTAAQTNVVPNIKIGRSLSQRQIGNLSYLERGLAAAEGEIKREIVAAELTMARELVQGVRQTMNLLCAAMYLDGVVYDRFGVKIAAGFGTPADCKSTVVDPAKTWTDANIATMDAITDLQQLATAVRVKYGKVYNRVDMSTSQFQRIIKSTLFRSAVRSYLGLQPTDEVSLSIHNIAQSQRLFEAISGLVLILEDTTVVAQRQDGTDATSKVVPENKVILTSSADDNNATRFDFAQGIPEELIVGRLVDNAPALDVVQPGIASYYEGSMNPPDIRCWAVVKGWARKFDVYSSAILTVS